MKKCLVLLFISFLLMSSIGKGQEVPATKIVENGGTGSYKALITGDSSLPNHTIYRPQNLQQATVDSKLPVVLFGNGGCANSSAGFINFLNEIASQGYVVIAIGPYKTLFADRNAPEIRQQTNPTQLLEALDWIIAQNKDSKSVYFNKIDVSKVAVMGQSCGGLQALSVSTDSRITTTVALNSGVLNSPPPANIKVPIVSKDILQKLHAPIAYIIGDTEDIAYPNAMDDFSRIKKLPVLMANQKVGHGGTFQQLHGGSFAKVAIGWLNWQLKGNHQSSDLFQGPDCGLCDKDGWRIESKNLGLINK